MKIAFLDKLRGISILMVFLFHALGAAYGTDQLPWIGMFRDFSSPPSGNTFFILYPFTFGWVGVASFFVISGFCIHLSFVNNPSWADFFARRFFRIYPPYLIVLILLILIYGADRYNIISHVFLFHNLSQSTILGINGSLWSVAVEFQLYMIYPLLFFIAGKFGWKKALLMSALVEFSLQAYHIYLFMENSESLAFPIWQSPFGYWFSWSVGAYLAEEYINNRIVLYKPIYVWIVSLVAILMSFYKPIISLAFPLWSISAMMVLSNNLNNMNTNDSFFNRHLAFLGICSYSFYLVHQPIVKFVAFAIQVIGIRNRFFVFWIADLSYIGILILSYGLYKIVELNSSKIGKYLTVRSKNDG